jgi:hypothetical protein
VLLPAVGLKLWVLYILAAALFAASFATSLGSLKNTLVRRQSVLSIRSTIGVTLVFGVVVLVNAVGATAFQRIDLTGSSQFTLTSQTRGVLEGLSEPVEIIGFFSPDVPTEVIEYAKNLLGEYQIVSDQLNVKWLDPEVNPEQARRYEVGEAGAVLGVLVFESRDGRRLVYGPEVLNQAEHAFTSAILEVSGKTRKIIYFASDGGYGEFDRAANGLRDNLYSVQEFDFVNASRVPDDASGLVIASRNERLSSIQESALVGYLESGGAMVLLMDPNPDLSWRAFIARWGIGVIDGAVVEPDLHVVPNAGAALVGANRNQFNFQELQFLGVTALLPATAPVSGVSIVPLVWSTDEAWLEVDPLIDSNVTQGMDEIGGPFAFGVLIEDADSRAVILGDSDFVANANFHNVENADFFATTINWLTANEEIISVDRKVLSTRRLILTPDEEKILRVSAMGLIPVLVLLAGLLVWWRRRLL